MPKLSTIPLLPDPQYAPISYHHQQSYDPYSNYSRSVPASQVMPSMVDPRYTHRELASTKSKSRMVSTPSREVKGMLDMAASCIHFDDLYIKPRHRFGPILHKAPG